MLSSILLIVWVVYYNKAPTPALYQPPPHTLVPNVLPCTTPLGNTDSPPLHRPIPLHTCSGCWPLEAGLERKDSHPSYSTALFVIEQ